MIGVLVVGGRVGTTLGVVGGLVGITLGVVTGGK